MKKTWILIKEKADYLIVIILTIIILICILKLWNTNIFKYPLSYKYGLDVTWTEANIKSLGENGWIYNNPDIGMPIGTDSYDFTDTSLFHNIILKIFIMILGSWVISVNMYYIFSFILVSIISLYVLKKLGISKEIAVVCAVLFSFLPYHFMRGIGHLFLSTYYMIPIMVWYALKFMKGDHLFIKKNNNYLNLNNMKTILVLMIIGAFGIYYAYFTCFLFCVAILYKILNKEKIRNILEIIGSIGIIISSIFLMTLPNFIYWIQNGKSVTVAARQGFETETYSLKISQMLLPITNHRFGLFAKIKEIYNIYPLTNENEKATLGLIMSIGLFVLFLCLIVPKRLKNNSDLHFISILNISSVLLATTGGFSTIVSFVLPEIRAYNRISVFIAMLTICCVAILLEELKKHLLIKGKNQRLIICILIGLLTFGIWDQTSTSYIPNYDNIKSDFNNDARFIDQIESSEEDGAMIYQMPYMKFPESAPINNMASYAHFIGYLHSSSLKWSYGAMRGREADNWLNKVDFLPIEEKLKTISLAGFEGIYIDRFAYTEEEQGNIEEALRNYLKVEPIISSNNRLIYYNLDTYIEELKNQYTEEEFTREQVLINILDTWGAGFSGLEINSENHDTWRWCEKSGILELYNPSLVNQIVTLKMQFLTGHEDDYNLIVKGENFIDTIAISVHKKEYIKEIELKHGINKITFTSDAPYLEIANDPRKMSFAIMNYQMN